MSGEIATIVRVRLPEGLQDDDPNVLKLRRSGDRRERVSLPWVEGGTLKA
jgi:hypothetical protein